MADGLSEYMNDVRWLPVFNGSGGTIPSHAIMLVTGIDGDGVINVTQPDSNSIPPYKLMVNGATPIASAEYGAGTTDYPAHVLYDTADGTPVNGDTWGCKSGEWKLRKNYLGFWVHDEVESGLVSVVVACGPARAKVKGKLDGALSFGGSATLSVWEWNGAAEADTGENITVYDWLLASGQTVASGIPVTAFYDVNSRRWYLDGAQCV